MGERLAKDLVPHTPGHFPVGVLGGESGGSASGQTFFFGGALCALNLRKATACAIWRDEV